MFVKIENWDGGTPLILNTDNIKAIHHYMGQSECFRDMWEVVFDIRDNSECRYLITNEQYTELCKILTRGIN